MSLLHCKKCHHEWEGEENSKCDWCGEDSFVLVETTSLELSISKLLQEGFLEHFFEGNV